MKLLKWLWSMSGAAGMVACSHASTFPTHSPENVHWMSISMVLFLVWGLALLFFKE